RNDVAAASHNGRALPTGRLLGVHLSNRLRLSDSYLWRNSRSGRYPAFFMSSSHLAGSLISLIAVPGLPASTCTLFLAGSPQTMNSTMLMAGVVSIFSQPGNLGYHGGSFPLSAFLSRRAFPSSVLKEPWTLPKEP